MKRLERLGFSLVLALVLALSACGGEGEVEENVEESGETIEEGLEESGEAIEEGVEQSEEAIEEGVEQSEEAIEDDGNEY
jgi:hypothetical protein